MLGPIGLKRLGFKPSIYRTVKKLHDRGALAGSTLPPIRYRGQSVPSLEAAITLFGRERVLACVEHAQLLTRARAAWVARRRARGEDVRDSSSSASSSASSAASSSSGQHGCWGNHHLHPAGAWKTKPELSERMSRCLQVVQYNCQSASCDDPEDERDGAKSLKEVCLTFESAQILCLQGTRIPARSGTASHEFTIHTEQSRRKMLVWGRKPRSSHHPDEHVGVAVGLAGGLFQAKVERFDPPEEIQGWVGAARVSIPCRRAPVDLLIVSFVLPQTHARAETTVKNDEIRLAVLHWIDETLSLMAARAARCTPILAFDGNAHFLSSPLGLDPLRQPVGPARDWMAANARREDANAQMLRPFLKRHRLYLPSTFSDVGPTFFGNSGQRTRIDYVALPTGLRDRLLYTKTLLREARMLNGPCRRLRDHVPLEVRLRYRLEVRLVKTVQRTIWMHHDLRSATVSRAEAQKLELSLGACLVPAVLGPLRDALPGVIPATGTPADRAADLQHLWSTWSSGLHAAMVEAGFARKPHQPEVDRSALELIRWKQFTAASAAQLATAVATGLLALLLGRECLRVRRGIPARRIASVVMTPERELLVSLKVRGWLFLVWREFGRARRAKRRERSATCKAIRGFKQRRLDALVQADSDARTDLVWRLSKQIAGTHAAKGRSCRLLDDAPSGDDWQTWLRDNIGAQSTHCPTLDAASFCEPQPQLTPIPDFQPWSMADLRDALRRVKRGRQVARWAVPIETWLWLANTEELIDGGRALLEFVNFSRQFGWAPWQWEAGDLLALDKHNGKAGIDRLRTIYLLCPVGKALGAKALDCMETGGPEMDPCALAQSGFSASRRREEAMLTIAAIRWRARRAGTSTILSFEDVKQAFPTLSWDFLFDKLRAAVSRSSTATETDMRWLESIHRGATLWIQLPDGTWLRSALRRGTRQGDVTGPRLFKYGYGLMVADFLRAIIRLDPSLVVKLQESGGLSSLQEGDEIFIGLTLYADDTAHATVAAEVPANPEAICARARTQHALLADSLQVGDLYLEDSKRQLLVDIRGQGSQAAELDIVTRRLAGEGKYAQKAKFLGGLEARTGALKPEVEKRRQAAIGAFRTFQAFWKSRGVPFRWKRIVFFAVVISGSLLSGLTARAVDASSTLLEDLETVQTTLARWLCRSALPEVADRHGLTRVEVYARVGLFPVRVMLRAHRLRFFMAMLRQPRRHALALEAISSALPVLGGPVWGDDGSSLTSAAPPFLRLVCADVAALEKLFGFVPATLGSPDWVRFILSLEDFSTRALCEFFEDIDGGAVSEATDGDAPAGVDDEDPAPVLKKCSICGVEKKNIGAHMFRAHNLVTVARTVTSSQCPRCLKTFGSKELARVHYANGRAGGGPGTCPLPGTPGFRSLPKWD